MPQPPPRRQPVGEHFASVVFCLFAVLLFGCSGTTWKHVRTTPGYQPPKNIAIAISVEVAGEGIDEGASELRDSLADELRSRGIVARFVERPDGLVGTNAAELRVVQWSMGSRWERYWMKKEGEGYIVVIVRTTSPDGHPGYSGVARGYVEGGWYGGSYLNSASAAGDAIAKAIATGTAERPQSQ